MMSSFLLEYKSARLVMQGGNLEQSQLRGLIESGNAFMFLGERKDYEKCPVCSTLFDEYPNAFLDSGPANLPYQTGLYEKAVNKGLITKKNQLFARLPVRFASVAAENKLDGVLTPPTTLINTVDLCKAGSVDTISVADFIQLLNDSVDD